MNYNLWELYVLKMFFKRIVARMGTQLQWCVQIIVKIFSTPYFDFSLHNSTHYQKQALSYNLYFTISSFISLHILIFSFFFLFLFPFIFSLLQPSEVLELVSPLAAYVDQLLSDAILACDPDKAEKDLAKATKKKKKIVVEM